MDARINSDKRFALPNRLERVSGRAGAARYATDVLRAGFEGRALLLTTPGSVNWRSGGISDPIDIAAASDAVWTLDCDQGRALITTEIEAPRLEHDFAVSRLGWDLITIPWYEPEGALSAACAYANVAPERLLSDVETIGTNVRDAVVATRMVLSPGERDVLRDLGDDVGRALGDALDSWRPGASTDFDIAAVIADRLEAQGAKAVCLIVGGDERLRTLRHPLAIGAVLHDAVMAVVVARRGGLHVAATRLAVRRADDEILTLVESLAPLNDALVLGSRPGGTWGETVEKLAEGYGRLGQPDAWREHYQGGPVGFDQREFELAPGQYDSPFWNLPRRSGSAVAWNPSLRGGAKIEETYLMDDEVELLTVTPSWPLVESASGVTRSAVKVLQ